MLWILNVKLSRLLMSWSCRGIWIGFTKAFLYT